MTADLSRALRPAIVLFGIMVAHALLETARDALFLARLGPDRLAWAYLAIAGVAVGAVTLVRRWGGARDPRRILIAFLAISALGTAVLAATLSIAPSIVFALYVWTGLVATLIIPSFWLVVDRSLLITDAKRVFAVIGAGGGLGALAGYGSATVLGRLLAAEHLVTVGAIVFALSTITAIVLAPHPTEEPLRRIRPARVDRRAASARSLRYVRLLLVLAAISTIALTLGDLMFKRLVAERMHGEDLATVFGAVYTGLNVLGLTVQLLVTPRILDRLGVGGALTVLPVVLLATALGFIATGAVLAVIALKLGDGSLRHSVHRVATEILFLPLSSALRDAAKPIVDVVGQRGGQAAAALLTFFVASGEGGTWALGVMTAIAVAAWLVVIALTRRSYVQQFRDTLDAGEIQRDVRVPTLDGDAVSLLTASLSSPDESEAMAALDLLARRGNRIPALVLYHPSATIVRKALSLLEGEVRVDVARVLAHLTAHPDPEIRASALAAASRTGCHHERLQAALRDPEPAVRAAAVVALTDEAGLARLLEGTPEDRAALARAIARQPRELFRKVLDQLLARREPSVTREVLRVWAIAPALADVDRLILLLEDPHVRGEARRVFTASGHLDRLIAALDDPRTPLGVRRHLPRTISRFRTPIAAAALVARLLREPDGTTEFKLLRALGRMRADDPRLTLDPEPVRAYARRAIEDAIRYTTLGDRLLDEQELSKTSSSDLLGELLVEKRRHAIERVFRALGILHPRADMRSVHDAIMSIDDERRGAAQEILEHLVPADLRIPLLAVIDQRDSSSDHASRIYRTYEDLLRALLTDPSDSLRCVAAHHVAERRLIALRPELARLRPVTESVLVSHAFDQAIARLERHV